MMKGKPYLPRVVATAADVAAICTPSRSCPRSGPKANAPRVWATIRRTPRARRQQESGRGVYRMRSRDLLEDVLAFVGGKRTCSPLWVARGRACLCGWQAASRLGRLAGPGVVERPHRRLDV